MNLQIQSSAFDNGERIPDRYTTEGADVSPPITITGVPEDAEALVVICDDPDAPQPDPWVHWLIWDIPPNTPSLPDSVSTVESPDEVPEAVQGMNDFGNLGYGGPAPPPGHGTHHYRFTVYALRQPLDLSAGAERPELESAMENHVIEQAGLTGTYER